ncbi:MAG: hypothetical protein H8E44_01470 [Planctomycetes bacterium]|nr:hypothetical protein [Planctomycetota bacterium]
MVELIAAGELTHGEIAERLGVNRVTVWRIIHGQSRPDLQVRVDGAVSGFSREARRLGARWLKALIGKHVKVGLEGDGETARRCREFVINLFFEEVEPRPDGARVGFVATAVFNSLVELSPELKARVVEELGGPRDDTPQEDENQCQ